jgi:uncharacterized protein (DUF2147 family)
MSAKRILAGAITGLLLIANAALADPVLGKWKTIDDVNGKTKSIVELTMDGDWMTGKITEYFADLKASSPNCPAAKRNKPLEGLEIVWDMTKHGDEWKGGSILDPKSGHVYGCIMKPIDGGKKLSVRGFMGISLLGRNQTWVKAD